MKRVRTTVVRTDIRPKTKKARIDGRASELRHTKKGPQMRASQ
ncbi:hypothetical protein [Lysobacter gummosus]